MQAKLVDEKAIPDEKENYFQNDAKKGYYHDQGRMSRAEPDEKTLIMVISRRGIILKVILRRAGNSRRVDYSMRETSVVVRLFGGQLLFQTIEMYDTYVTKLVFC